MIFLAALGAGNTPFFKSIKKPKIYLIDYSVNIMVIYYSFSFAMDLF